MLTTGSLIPILLSMLDMTPFLFFLPSKQFHYLAIKSKKRELLRHDLRPDFLTPENSVGSIPLSGASQRSTSGAFSTVVRSRNGSGAFLVGRSVGRGAAGRSMCQGRRTNSPERARRSSGKTRDHKLLRPNTLIHPSIHYYYYFPTATERGRRRRRRPCALDRRRRRRTRKKLHYLGQRSNPKRPFSFLNGRI